MEEKEKLILAQEWIRQLANGINPLDGNAVKEDDVVNNVHISRCLFYVADILKNHARTKVSYAPKTEKNSPIETKLLEVDKYKYVDAISISAFAKEVENIIPNGVKAVNYKTMIKWLMQNGLLLESEPDSNGHTYKIATEKGKALGIYSEERIRDNGAKFLITLYNSQAQKYLLDHIAEMV